MNDGGLAGERVPDDSATVSLPSSASFQWDALLCWESRLPWPTRRDGSMLSPLIGRSTRTLRAENGAEGLRRNLNGHAAGRWRKPRALPGRRSVPGHALSKHRNTYKSDPITTAQSSRKGTPCAYGEPPLGAYGSHEDFHVTASGLRVITKRILDEKQGSAAGRPVVEVESSLSVQNVSFDVFVPVIF